MHYEITDLVLHYQEPHEIGMGGLMSVGDHDINDPDAGMPNIVEQWASQCEVNIVGRFD